MDDTWNELMKDVDWGEVERDIAENAEREKLIAYFWRDGFDFKRGYIRRIMSEHPELLDRFKIDAASEQMHESHALGVELSVDDALRFVENDKPVPTSELVKMLNAAGVTDENVYDVILGAATMESSCSTVKNAAAQKKARLMTECADILAENKDVLILGIPTFDPESSFTQVKLAFFGEDLTAPEVSALKALMQHADRYSLTEQHGVAVALFQLFNIWDK